MERPHRVYSAKLVRLHRRFDPFDALSVRVTSPYKLLHGHACESLDSTGTISPAASYYGLRLWTEITLVDAPVTS